MNNLQSFGAGLALLVGGALLGGCSSGGDFSTAKVQGQVVYQGKGVAHAAVVFSPVAEGDAAISGKSANGNADENGNFTLSTYDMGDGAIVGQHRVSVSTEDPAKPLPGQVPQDLIIEVKPGTNKVTIELVPY
jgi:hypothetical protein